jgi:hypothetical protein
VQKSKALPTPAARFIQGVNAGDLDLQLSCFAEDAIVSDQLCEHIGIEAIRLWAIRELIEKKLTVSVIEVRDHYTDVSLLARIDGDFDKRGLPDPLLHFFYFTLNRVKVVQLIVLPKPEEGS